MNPHPRVLVFISGQGTNLQALIDAVNTGIIDGEIVGVISNRSSAFGLERAKKAGIQTELIPYAPHKTALDPKSSYDQHLAERVHMFRPDLIVLAGFMRILTTAFLSRVSIPMFNLHPALPGTYDGIQAMERAWSDFQAGRIENTGVMVHEVIEQVDGGPVLGTRSLKMSQFDNFQSFKSAMHALERELLVEIVRDWCHSR